MTTFKPKMFKSQNGCCICRAKSSSSRFTTSERYATSFQGCFQVEEERRGDICNACVLIVKRWNKLPASVTKNWAHVVDARQGPGMKIVSRPKKKEEEVECLKYKHKYIRKGGSKIPAVPVQVSRSRNNSEGSNRSVSPVISEKTGSASVSCSASGSSSGSNSGSNSGSSSPLPSLYPDFLDPLYWRRIKVCCGILFIGQLGEVMMDQRFYKKCSRSADCQTRGGHHAIKDVEGSESGENDSEVESSEFFPVNHGVEKTQVETEDLSGDPDPPLASHLETFSCVST